MRRTIYILFSVMLLSSCFGDGDQFSSYQRTFMGKTQIGSSVSKIITLQNPSTDSVQHIFGLNFDAAANPDGHFRIDKVEVGGVAQNPKDHDITVPAGSLLQVYVTYQPLNLNTTVADYGGWSTGEPEPWIPKKPDDTGTTSAVKAMQALLPKADDAPITIDSNEKAAIHRAMLVVVYDQPKIGYAYTELIGEAVPGPNGEVTVAGSGGECPSDTGVLCYKGGFAMELPDIVTTGPKPLNMSGPIVFKLSGSSVSIDMGTFPSELLVLKGNGPGEPLEGKPISAISIVVSGAEKVTATGTFDGTNLEVNNVAFRIRVILGEITDKDINPGLQAAVDFNVKDLTIKTSKPLTNGSIGLKVEAVLAKEPSGNPLFDQFLGGTRVVVTMDGTLQAQ